MSGSCSLGSRSCNIVVRWRCVKVFTNNNTGNASEGCSSTVNNPPETPETLIFSLHQNMKSSGKMFAGSVKPSLNFKVTELKKIFNKISPRKQITLNKMGFRATLYEFLINLTFDSAVLTPSGSILVKTITQDHWAQSWDQFYKLPISVWRKWNTTAPVHTYMI